LSIHGKWGKRRQRCTCTAGEENPKAKKRVIFCSYFQDSPDPCNMFFLPTQEYVNILGWLLEGGEAEKG
jgi:hypothetical protein